MHNTRYEFPSSLRSDGSLRAVVNSNRTVKYDATGGDVIGWADMSRAEMADLIKSYRSNDINFKRNRLHLAI